MMFVALYGVLCFLKLLNIMRVQDLFVIIIIEMFKKVISFLIVVLIIVSGFAFFAFFLAASAGPRRWKSRYTACSLSQLICRGEYYCFEAGRPRHRREMT